VVVKVVLPCSITSTRTYGAGGCGPCVEVDMVGRTIGVERASPNEITIIAKKMTAATMIATLLTRLGVGTSVKTVSE